MKKILFLLFIYAVFNLPSYAVLTTDDAISPEYMKTHGYSDEASRLIYIEHQRINGRNDIIKKQEDAQVPVSKRAKYIKNIFNYIDPATDNGQFGGDHSIRYHSRWDDL